MTYNIFKKKFTEKALIAGYSQDNIDKCLNYAKPIIEKEFPVIFNTSNLAALVGYNKNYIKRAVYFSNYFYREFTIKKKNGKLRVIKEPLPSLKEIQGWILENILYNYPVSRFAKAYIKGKSILENVRYHKGKDIVLVLDISDFFNNVGIVDVESIFRKAGYSENVSNLLAKLCCANAVLPQGAPTSPALTNIFMFQFDEKVSVFCKQKDIRYTRYADDLTFSYDNSEMSNEIILFISQNLRELGLEINSEKTKVLKKSDRQVVTGIVVNEKLQMPKEKRREIRKEVYYIKKFGLAEHLKRTNNGRANYIQHLEGKINYSLHINPDDLQMLKLKEYVQSLRMN